MGKTNQKLKPDTESVRLTYDELEIALIAMSIRQEELREAHSTLNNPELEALWYVCDKMDRAQRSLESKMTRQVSDWLRSVEKNSKSLTKKTKSKPRVGGKTKPGKQVPSMHRWLFSQLSRITRL